VRTVVLAVEKVVALFAVDSFPSKATCRTSVRDDVFVASSTG
jgi:hypothetical protein